VFRSALHAVGLETPPVAVDMPSEPASTNQRRSPASAGQNLEPKAAPVETEASPVQPDPSPAVEPPAVQKGAQSGAPAKGADGHELYRRGHRAHFKEGKPAEAIEAYDAYLKQQPSGRFAVDARYNRALCLVRLGRYGEAQQALAPFANGEFGGYRKQDARRLLDALQQ
jgi:TolA-binding protein